MLKSRRLRFIDSEEPVKRPEWLHTQKGDMTHKQCGYLRKNGFHSCAPLTRENGVSTPRVNTPAADRRNELWQLLLVKSAVITGTSDFGCKPLAEDGSSPRMNDFPFLFFFLLFFFTATMHPVKRPIMCGSILGKSDNCLPLENMQKRRRSSVKKARMAEKGQQLCMLLCMCVCVFIHVHVEKAKK